MYNNKPIIGIIPTFNLENKVNDPYLDKASFVRMYANKIIDAGGIPIGLLSDNIDDYLSICDGYLWPGGSEINTIFFKVIDDAIINKKPLLGICLGMQAIASYFNLKHDKKMNLVKFKTDTNYYLEELKDNSKHDHNITNDAATIASAKHNIKLNRNSLLYKIYQQDKLKVVSLHKYIVKNVSADLLVSACSCENYIEAIEYTKRESQIIGVQFHPEIEEYSFLFDWLIKVCYKKYLFLINKDNKIPADFNPRIILYNSKYPNSSDESNMAEIVYLPWFYLKKAMHKRGYLIDVESAYRPYEMQSKLFNNILKEKGLEHTLKFVAKPGYSEHQTGFAIDICLKINGAWVNEFDFRLNNCYQVLKEIIADYGFIIRYPKGKETITGYHYEPWHIRFVGSSKIAHEIMDNHKTLEEYLNNNYYK